MLSFFYWTASKRAPCSKGRHHPYLSKLFTTQTSCNKNSYVQKSERPIELFFFFFKQYPLLVSTPSWLLVNLSTPSATLINLTNRGWDQIHLICLIEHLIETVFNRTPLCQQDLQSAGWGQPAILTNHDLKGPRLNLLNRPHEIIKQPWKAR